MIRHAMFAAAMTVALLSTAPADDAKYPTVGTIERKDPQFDQLIAKDAKIEKLADGFDWAEGPAWMSEGKYLLFSDIPKNTVWKWKEGEGATPFMKPSGFSGGGPFTGREPGSNGLLLDKEGRLILCMHGDRCVARREKDGKITVLASRYDDKRFNSPNDAVFHSSGDLYFTDPPYGLPKGMDDPAKELKFQGVYRLAAKDGKVSLLTPDVSRPNGIAFSPDEKTLYVANSDAERPVWIAFGVKPDGTIDKGRVFFDAAPWLKAGKKGLPDGMKVDRAGNVFATGPGGVHVFSPKGEHLGSIDPGVATANCGWGDDGSVLYLTADKWLCRVKTLTKGK